MPVPTRFALNYFHVSMKLRHIDQCIGAISPMAPSPDGSVFELYDRFNYLRGYLWSGRRAKFEDSVGRLMEFLDRPEEIFPDIHQTIHRAAGHLCDLAWYIRKNESGVTNYGQWRRDGRRIFTSILWDFEIHELHSGRITSTAAAVNRSASTLWLADV
jgi:hypothetical protein